MALTTKGDRQPSLKLRLLALLVSILSASCSATQPEAKVVQPAVTTDSVTAEKVENTSSIEPIKSALNSRNVSAVPAIEAGEDAFVIENHSQTVASALSATPLEIDEGMPYAEARAQIIRQGWVPEDGSEPGPYGVERALYEAGYTEVESCAGTGLGPCIFYFSHPERTGPNEENILRVGTNGGASQTQISGWDTYHHDGTTVTSEVVSEIPSQFHGEWNANGEECGSVRGEGRLSLSAGRVSFYESSGPVTEVVAQGESKITVYTTLSGEGESFTDITTFELFEEGSSLIDSANSRVWERCSGQSMP